ncbi:MAG: hypothetical protein VCD50_04280 [Alphaproteobacteria bacterium]|jgi:hypothetical protein
MYEIDPSRTDLAEEFKKNPGGPYSPELTLVVNRLRLGPMEERTIMVCTKRGREWTLAKMPTVRGAKLEYYEDLVFDDYYDAAREIFRMRWHTVTGQELA